MALMLQLLAHHVGRADDAIEAGLVGYFDDGRDASSFSADHDAESVLELNFAVEIVVVVEFVFEALDEDRIFIAV